MSLPNLTTYEEELKEEIKYKMGSPIVLLENEADDTLWKIIFKTSKRWLKKFYCQDNCAVIAIPSSHKMLLSDINADIDDVLDVIQESQEGSAMSGLNQFFSDLPLGAGVPQIQTVSHTLFSQHMSDREDAQRVFGADLDWMVECGYLHFTPKTSSATIALVKYSLKNIDSEKIESPWDDHFMSRLVSELKNHVGRYRSKFKSISTPSGDIESDGEKLLDESIEGLKDLETDIRENRSAVGMFLM